MPKAGADIITPETGNEKMQFTADLPEDLKDLLANCPKTGSGERLVHRWIMECGTRLRHFVLLDVAAGLIAAHISRSAKLREIEDTLEKAYGQIVSDNLLKPFQAWPEPNPWLIDNIVAETDCGTPGLTLLRNDSFPIPPDAGQILGARFDPQTLICAGLYKEHSVIGRLEGFKNLERFQFVVPNPMRHRFVTLENGRRAERVLANVVERHYLVLDFDLRHDSLRPVLNHWASVKYTPQDGMALLIRFLARGSPLSMVVFSGNHSLQAWFDVRGIWEYRLAAWFNDACLLGADPAGWVTCQYFRMPRGIRKETGQEQEVIYFKP